MTDLRLSGIGMTSARTRDRLVQRLREQGIANLAVLDRIRNVPRHIFVDEALGSRAYEDTALPIGYGQTISQPYIVARMTEALLAAGAADSVLEVGTGCGYQTAVRATSAASRSPRARPSAAGGRGRGPLGGRGGAARASAPGARPPCAAGCGRRRVRGP